MLYGLGARIRCGAAEGPARSPAFQLDCFGTAHEKPSPVPQGSFHVPAAPLRWRSSGTVLTGACTSQGAAVALRRPTTTASGRVGSPNLAAPCR